MDEEVTLRVLPWYELQGLLAAALAASKAVALALPPQSWLERARLATLPANRFGNIRKPRIVR